MNGSTMIRAIWGGFCRFVQYNSTLWPYSIEPAIGLAMTSCVNGAVLATAVSVAKCCQHC